MQRSSWVALGLSILLTALLTVGYLSSRSKAQHFDAAQAEKVLHDLQVDTRQKDVEGIMRYIAPNTRLMGDLDTNRVRLLLMRAFNAMQNPQPDVSDVQFHDDPDEPSLSFLLNLRDQGPDYTSDEYGGRITLYFHQANISHLFGLYHTSEWRIVHVDTTGPSPDTFGDF